MLEARLCRIGQQSQLTTYHYELLAYDMAHLHLILTTHLYNWGEQCGGRLRDFVLYRFVFILMPFFVMRYPTCVRSLVRDENELHAWLADN